MSATGRVLVGLLAWGTLSFGAVYPWAYWPLAVGCAAIGVWLIWRLQAWREPRPRRVGLAFLCIAVAIGAQLVPLPYDWFRTLSPAAEPVLSQLRIGWVMRPSGAHALSIDPASTLTALALFVAFALLTVGLMRAASHLPLDWMVSQLTVFGLLLALFAIVQRVLAGPGDIPVYGFWRASGYATPFGPFINRNHFAGWMVLFVPSAIAAATVRLQNARGPFHEDWRGWLGWLTTPDASRFVFTVVAILVMMVALVLSGSRSGLISIVAAIAVLGYCAARGRHGRVRRVLPALYLLLFVIAAVGWVGIDRTIVRFSGARQELAERAAAWLDTWRIARDFPVAGVGFGGYGLAMLVYQTSGRHSIYAQAHNDYLQILADGGALVAVPVAAAMALVVAGIRHRFRRDDPPAAYWLRAGATAGLAGIAVQSTLDFSLQMPGNAMMFAVLLAIALHRPSTHHAHRV
jgi:O-antigen ligase